VLDKVREHDSSPESSLLTAATTPAPGFNGRFPMLDGWRAISILLVLAAHMFPLGPKRWALNEPVGALGMAVFFCLSGFLIVRLLLRGPTVTSFLIRRFARILPLAWVALAFAFIVYGARPAAWPANFLFYANLPPFLLEPRTSHFWSLDVEMQFYVGIALAVLIGRSRALWLVPAAALAVTSLRVETNTLVSIVTWLRVDEILTGGTLALILQTAPGSLTQRTLRRLPFWPLVILFLLSTHLHFSLLNYARPYITAAMIGVTIVRPIPGVTRLLQAPFMAYLASISYAVYIIHHFMMFGWFNSGTTLVKYAKRPLALAVTFGLSHISTFYFERRITDWAHRFTRRHRRPLPSTAV
jgi:peptidoglycan/LPS O-acetylase OafA/YrhL